MKSESKLESVLSIQLWSLRQLGEIEAQLATVKRSGLTKVETIGGNLKDPKRLTAALAANGLTAPSTHVGMDDLRSNLDGVAEACRIVGIGQLFMPAFGEDERGDRAAAWQSRGAELGTMAERLAKYGLTFGYHNHNWEFVKTEDGSTALENLFKGAAGSPLRWQADVAWIARGGQAPLDWLKRYAGILVSAHVKDMAPAGKNLDQDGWCDVGSGTLDWPTLWTESRRLGAGLMVLEHDNPTAPEAFAANSRKYLAEMTRSMKW